MDTTDKRVRPRLGSRRKQIERVERHGITVTAARWAWILAQSRSAGVSASMYLAIAIDYMKRNVDDHK